jgi:small subunit ribosomal protein S14
MSTAAKEFKASSLKKKSKYKTRVYNRCSLTGRSKGYIRYFGLSRIAFRELALKGELPGVSKTNY